MKLICYFHSSLLIIETFTMRKFLIIIFLGINTILSATNYYVRNGGNDSNSGIDDAHAWAHHPWMSTWTGSVALVAGDNIYMKRGDIWSIASPTAPFLTVSQSGSSGKLILTGTYGAGNKPIIKITTDSNFPVIRGISKSYISFTNLEIIHFNDVADLSQTQCGIHITESGGVIPHDWVISGCSIHNIPFIGIFADGDSYNMTIGDMSATTCATASSYSNEIYNCYYGAVILYGKNPSTNRSDFNVFYNYIHDIGNGIYNVDAYGIAFTEGVLSSGWPAYCTARYNRVENIIGWEGIETHGGTYMYFQDNYIYNCAIGIAAFAADRSGYAPAVLNHCYIERNTIEAPAAHPTNFYSGIIVAGENILLRPTTCYISNNTLFYTNRPAETSGRAITVQTSDGVIIEGNTIYNGPTGSSQGAICLGGNAGWKTKNITVRNNWIKNWDAGINIIFQSIDGNISCYNNIVYSHLRSMVGEDGNFIGDIKVFNNVLVSTWSVLYDYAIGFDEGSTTTIQAGSSLSIKNNIVGFTFPISKGVYIRTPVVINGTINIDYNLYWNSASASPYYSQNSAYTWESWKGLLNDTHSLYNTDPLFKNNSGSYSESVDFALQSISPVINRGTNLSEVTNDFFGNPRDATPDIGAYEYIVPVSGITITAVGGSNSINTNKGSLQLITVVSPSDATNKKVTWSISNETGKATISSSGILTALSNGTVTAIATSTDGSGIYGSLSISITNQNVLIESVVLSGENGNVTISENKGTLQLNALIFPSNATNTTLTWSIGHGTGQASINSSGLVTAIANGTISVIAVANDGSGVYGTISIKIINQGNADSANMNSQPYKIYPNPAHEFITIFIAEQQLVPDFVRIYTLSGSEVFFYRWKPDIRELQIPLNLYDGIYFIQMRAGNSILYSHKLIIAN